MREEGRDCEGGKRGGGRQNTRGVGWAGGGMGRGRKRIRPRPDLSMSV
jgi:hypothetical protein